MAKENFDICIIGLKCRDLLLEEENPRYLGGIEKMLVSLALALVDQGLKVAFVTYGTEPAVTHRGIRIYSAFEKEQGIRVVRNLHPRLTRFWSLFREINAHTYIQMGAGIETAFSCLVSKYFLGKRFVYLLASDSDCMADVPSIKSKFEEIGYLWGLRNATVRISQTTNQQRMLQQNFSLSSNVVPIPHIRNTAETQDDNKPDVLWVGRPIPGKRLEMLLEVAELHPNLAFHVAGADNNDSEYSRNVSARAKQAENVTVHGKVSETKLLSLFTHCKILACTSKLEGFPTTFLEAWSLGKPVLTTFDPDDIVAKNQVGMVASGANDFAEHLGMLIDNTALYDTLSQQSLEFYNANYSPGAVVPKFLKIVENES